jgi:HD-like signal output (HDOD) protein/ActR/RegA family two-component response regulator
MKKIIFVDDEFQVLDGLRDALRKRRHMWQMEFFSTPFEAMARLAEGPADIVVSDMRMPEMDGATFLKWVRGNADCSARIILSGQADRDAILRALPVSHQFLSKPCSAEILELVLDRTLRMQACWGNPAASHIASAVSSLPVTPDVYDQLTELVKLPGVKLEDMIRIVETAPCVACRILQMANSAYFGKHRHIRSITEAVTFLGHEVVRTILSSPEIFYRMEEAKADEYWTGSRHKSARAARYAASFVKDPVASQEAFSAALLMDVGKYVLSQFHSDLLSQAELLTKNDPLNAAKHETAAMGCTHAQIGAYLLGIWGLPFSIVQAVAGHHAPLATSSSNTDVIAATHVSACLVEAEDNNRSPFDLLEQAFIESNGLGATIDQWIRSTESLKAA